MRCTLAALAISAVFTSGCLSSNGVEVNLTGGGQHVAGTNDVDAGGSGGDDVSGVEAAAQAVVTLVNEARAAEGIGPLRRSAVLDRAAQRHAQDMRDNSFFDHTGSDGSTAAVRVSDAGYQWSRVGENIAWGHSDAAAVMRGWLNSDGHRANILNPEFEEIGVAYDSDGMALWVQVFARP